LTGAFLSAQCQTLKSRFLRPRFSGIGYLFMMAIANVCYFAGPLSESLIKPQNVERYRRMTFQLGLWFSVVITENLVRIRSTSARIADRGNFEAASKVF
jgi:hypothetical protein